MTDDDIDLYPVPNPEWTPRQQENWDEHMQAVYERLETDVGRYWYRRTWRPKKRNAGKLERDHVEFGTPEDYIVAHIEDTLQPMGSMMGVMMRKIGKHDDDSELQQALEDITQARLQQIADDDPHRAKRLLEQTEKIAGLYGVSDA